MNKFWEILKPKLVQYKIESLLLSAAFGICITSLLIYFNSFNNTIQSLQTTAPEKIEKSTPPDMITVEVAGSVTSPGVYTLPIGSRIKDLIEKADGITNTADSKFLAVQLNQALILNDQQKVFIPSTEDFEALGKAKDRSELSLNITSQETQDTRLDLNSASSKDLESLPGVGMVTAEKIINGRPYTKLEELLSKKIVGNALFNKIKDSLSIPQ